MAASRDETDILNTQTAARLERLSIHHRTLFRELPTEEPIEKSYEKCNTKMAFVSMVPKLNY